MLKQYPNVVFTPDLKSVVKALELCAEAHGVKFWQEGVAEGFEPQAGFLADSVPLYADVCSICEAFYGSTSMIDHSSSWGTITVYLDSMRVMHEIDLEKLGFALPYGTVKLPADGSLVRLMPDGSLVKLPTDGMRMRPDAAVKAYSRSCGENFKATSRKVFKKKKTASSDLGVSKKKVNKLK